jgi:hypothetical protein
VLAARSLSSCLLRVASIGNSVFVGTTFTRRPGAETNPTPALNSDAIVLLGHLRWHRSPTEVKKSVQIGTLVNLCEIKLPVALVPC